jgi:dihydroorotate dehydrogenase (fumarate)
MAASAPAWRRTSGVHGAEDVIKLLMVGADVTMLCSALLRNGIGHIRHVEQGVRSGWKNTNMNRCTRCKAA